MRDELRDIEKRAFRAAVDTGLWDVMIASVVAMLAIGPLLSGTLGDFGASAVFLPVWAILYWVLLRVQRRVVEPRVGVVRFGVERKARLTRFSVIMLALNVVALAAGTYAAFHAGAAWSPPVLFGLMVLLMFSVAAYFLDIPRYFGYGLLLVAAGAAGEVLWRRGLASHHGYPVVFGISAVVIAGVGLLRLAKHLPPRAPTDSTAAAGGGHD